MSNETNFKDLPKIINIESPIIDIIDESIYQNDPKEKEKAIKEIKDSESDHIQIIKK